MLLVTFGAVAAWLITGFNIVEGAVPLIGIQWSTFATFTFFFYLMMMNFQTGGLNSFRQLWGGMKMDVHFLVHLKSRRDYPRDCEVNPIRAFVVSLLVCMSALFAFEAVWVFLYDWFQFGSLMWPVYSATTSFSILVRNFGLFIMPLMIAWIILPLQIDLTRNRFAVKFRVNEGWLMLLALAVASWMFWITMPHQIVNVAQLVPAQIIGPLGYTFQQGGCYVWPSQGFFPQNTYTFYPCHYGPGTAYDVSQILGFFSSDNWVHAANVLTKFITVGAVCYPFMAYVRRLP